MPALRRIVTTANNGAAAFGSAGAAAPPAGDVAEDPPPPNSPYASAPAGTPSATHAPPPEPPASPTLDKSKLELVAADRLAELDAAVGSGLLDQMQEAERQVEQMQGIAAIHGVDLDNPAKALAPLKKAAAGALDKHDQAELKLGLGLLNAAKDTLNNALIALRAESMTLRRSLAALRNTPKPPEAKTEDNDPGNDKAAHAYDEGVQGLKVLAELPGAIDTVGKALLEVVGGYVSTALELVGLDVLKDLVKGGNADELLASLKTAVDELQGTVGDIITELQREAAEQAADAETTLEALLRAVLEEHEHFVTAAGQFDAQLKAAMAQAMQSRAGKRGGASDDLKGIMAVHQAVLDAAEAGQAAAVAVSKQGKVLGDLRYWESVLVPLGKRDTDGQVMSEAGGEYRVYLHGSRRIAFIFPSGGLKTSLEDLSGAVGMMRKLYPGGGDAMEKLRDKWMAAMVGAL